MIKQDLLTIFAENSIVADDIDAYVYRFKNVSEKRIRQAVLLAIDFAPKRNVRLSHVEMFVRTDKIECPEVGCKYCGGTGVVVAERDSLTKEFDCNECISYNDRDLEKWCDGFRRQRWKRVY